jgi:hypothetical protein
VTDVHSCHPHLADLALEPVGRSAQKVRVEGRRHVSYGREGQLRLLDQHVDRPLPHLRCHRAGHLGGDLEGHPADDNAE